MTATDFAALYGLCAGSLLATLIVGAIALLIHHQAMQRIEARALIHGFRLGRRNKMKSLEVELLALDWKGNVYLPAGSEGSILNHPRYSDLAKRFGGDSAGNFPEKIKGGDAGE